MQKVISASRRTDIPAFYLDWFLHRLRLGSFKLANPYNGKIRTVAVSKASVGAIVFWSKNFAPLLKKVRELSGWPAVFNFTLNSENSLLEPGVPPLDERKEQIRSLARIYGAQAVRWRFDPVVFYNNDGVERNNLDSFEHLLEFAAGLGIDSCTVSFMDFYRKIAEREKHLPGFSFLYPDKERLIETAAWMAGLADRYGIRLFTCCEAGLGDVKIENLAPGRCIDHDLIFRLYGAKLNCKQDMGQRKAAGCLCHQSVDVGSYREHPCLCGCLYCYANPVVKPEGA